MALTEQQKIDYVREVFDDKRVQLKCGKHLYFGPVKGRPEVIPMLGCVDCWKVFYVYEMASTPANERGQKLAELEEVLHNVVQMVEEGKFDFEPYPHAQIEIGQE